VHIRNMSQTGALIEASRVPDPGAAVILKRGALHISGQIAWKVERKAGIVFSTKVNVADWLSRPAGAHQEKVDDIVSSLRAVAHPGGAVDATNISSDTSIVAELAALRADLVQLGNGLANDTILVATHPEIQMIDVALQRVDRVIGQLRNT
jgi:hypothetical protein